MKDINQSSRRRFIKAGGIFIAAYGVGAAVKAFAKEKEKENEEVSTAAIYHFLLPQFRKYKY